MLGPYERTATGADVLACARQAGLGDQALGRVSTLLPAGNGVADLDELEVRAGPAALGIAPARWVAVFGPLFGEFE